MSHNINLNNGKYSFVSVREKPWHGLGQIVQNRMTSQDAIIHSGLDFTVEKRPLYVINDTKRKKVDRHFATCRQDNDEILGIVGSQYQIVQNQEAFQFFDAIVGEGAAIYETAGVLGKGEIIFITAKLPKTIRVQKDVVEQYLFITSSHDGTSSIRAAFTPVRIVCNNTLNLALSRAGHMVNIRHTRNAHKSLIEAHKLMGIVGKDADRLEALLNKMSHVRISDEQLRRMAEIAIMPNREQATSEMSTKLQNIVDNMLEYNFQNDTQKTHECKGTLYGALNMVTGYYQNAVIYDADNADARLKDTVLGNAARKGARALDLAIRVLSDSSILG
jgi:phage/plasmid-like protein (TIGR03299 family)